MLSYDALCSMQQVKDFLQIDDSDAYITTKENLVQQSIMGATRAIERYCHKRKFRYKSVTEHIDGTGSSRIAVSRYPIISVTSLYDDTARSFGSSTEISSSNYVIDSEMGTIRLYNDYAQFTKGRQNVKVTYVGGYGFEVESGINDRLDFNEGDSELTASLTAGTYSYRTLATHVATQMAAVEGAAGTYTVKYSLITGKFTISIDSGTFQILPSSGSNWDRSGWGLLGWDDESDPDAAGSHTSEHAVIGIPEDLTFACIATASQMFQLSMNGDNRLGRESRSVSTGGYGGTERFDTSLLPDQVKEILDPYVPLVIG